MTHLREELKRSKDKLAELQAKNGELAARVRETIPVDFTSRVYCSSFFVQNQVKLELI